MTETMNRTSWHQLHVLLLLVLLSLQPHVLFATVVKDDEGTCSNDSGDCKHDTGTKAKAYSREPVPNKPENDVYTSRNKAHLTEDFAQEIDVESILAGTAAIHKELGSEYDISDQKYFRKVASAIVSNMVATDKEGLDKEQETDIPNGGFVYPPLTRRTAKRPGDIIEVDIAGQGKVKMIARAVRPPIFEVPGFLTDEECDVLINASMTRGTWKSSIFVSKSAVNAGKDQTKYRESETSSLDEEHLGAAFINRLHNKLAQLLDLPVQVIINSGPVMIAKYVSGGHYHAHLDSGTIDRKLPCCFQTTCTDEDGEKKDTTDCCRMCRYVTVLHYLNDVEEGGETAFPFADLTFTQISEASDWENLTSNCDKASLVVKPGKGKTVVFYNHLTDRHGYLGGVDLRSHHGGCDVIKGTKWIATNWITAPSFSDRRRPSKHVDGKTNKNS